MPIIGSISGSFGYGRSPQTAPPPGFTIYPAIGNLRNWSFSSNGTCTFDGNNISSASGNVFVITPTTTFVCNVKIWGGGGGGGNLEPTPGNNPVAGSGGATHGQVLFKAGQPYTIFSGGAGNVILNNPVYSTPLGAGGGGSASGILEGNLYANTSVVLSEIAIAGGGGGASLTSGGDGFSPPKSTAGGGNTAQFGYTGGSGRAPSLPLTTGSGAHIPFPVSYAALSAAYTGGYHSSITGGGGGGKVGGNFGGGGTGYAITSDLELSTAAGVYGLPPLYDDTLRSNAGDSDSPGRVVLFLDEYRPTTIVATGGDITDVPIPGQTLAYRYHTFSSNGKFIVTSASTVDKIDVIAVGGGGGGSRSPYGSPGGGGGGVALRNGLPIGVGTYNVTVGKGGLPDLPTLANVGLGGIYGGYRGTDSAFFTNPLAAKFMPDNYWRLINSFGSRIIYVSISGSNTVDSGSITTPYATIEYAIDAVGETHELIVIVILSGTYSPVIDPNGVQTPISDHGRPRIFICAPNKVTINYTPTKAVGSSQRDSPVAILANRFSAVYGATFVRNMFETTNDRELAFFNNFAQPSSWPARGNFYNCVFKEALGKWALVYSNGNTNFKVENCTFYTKDAGTVTAVGAGWNAPLTLFKNCAFNKPVTTDAAFDNCVTNANISVKYVITGVADKGVFSGEYSWTAPITVPATTAKSIVYVGIGGGGGYHGTVLSPDAIGGSGGGGVNALYAGYSLQHNGILNSDYSGYGNRGGKGGDFGGYGGGGAMFEPLRAVGGAGGLGLEWPAGSSVYYGTGGDSNNTLDVTAGLTHFGRGGQGGSETAAGDGRVVVRYIVPGEYTAPTITANVNILAYGGQTVRQVGNYREHIFTSSGTFRLANLPFDSKLDIVLVGGGGGGHGSLYGGPYTGGKGGQVMYHSISTTTISQISDFTITIGSGGQRGTTYRSAGSYSIGISFNPTWGTTSMIQGANVSLSAGGGGAGGQFVDKVNGTAINSGLYGTNSVFYGGDGAAQNTGDGMAPGGGQSIYSSNDFNAFGGSGLNGLGGGGGSGPTHQYNFDWRNDPTSYSSGGLGGSGVVVIRYPYTP